MSRWYNQPSQDKVDEAIEKLANLIARRYRLSEAAIFALESSKPVAPILRQQIFFTIFPYLPMVGVLPGQDESDASLMKYLDILDKDENIEKLIHRIEEINKEVNAEEKQAKSSENKSGSFSERLKSRIRKR